MSMDELPKSVRDRLSAVSKEIKELGAAAKRQLKRKAEAKK